MVSDFRLWQLRLVKQDDKEKLLIQFLDDIKERDKGLRQKTKVVIFVTKPSTGRGQTSVV